MQRNNKSVRCQLIQLTLSNACSASPGGFEPLTPRLGELQPIVTLCQSEVR